MPKRNDEEVQGHPEETGGLRYPDAEDVFSDYEFVAWYFIPPQSRPETDLVLDGGKERQAQLQAIIDKIKSVQGKDVFYRAALLVSEINERSPFAVGNKKTSIIAMDVFLQQNKIKLEGNEEIVNSLANLLKDKDIESFASWLRNHSKPA